MSLFYQLQGFTPEESQKMAQRLAQQPEQFVQAMAQSELGLSEHRFPNQWSAALSAGISTAIGAFVPVIPFFFSGGLEAAFAFLRIPPGTPLCRGPMQIPLSHPAVVGPGPEVNSACVSRGGATQSRL